MNTPFDSPFEQLLREVNLEDLLALTLAFGLAFIAVIGGLGVAFVKVLKGGSKRTAAMDADETRGFQELQQSFKRMESRVESLETLIIDRAGYEKTSRLHDP